MDQRTQDADQSDEDYVAEFGTYMRWREANIGTASSTAYSIMGADKESAEIVGAAMKVFEEDVPNISDQSFLEAVSSLKDYAIAGVLDPTNLISLATAVATGGVGGAATKALIKTATDSALKAYVRQRVIKQTVWVGAVEAAGAGGLEVALQSGDKQAFIDPKTGKYDPTVDRNTLGYDYGEIALQTGIGAAIGAGSTALGAKKVFNQKLEASKAFHNIKAVEEAVVVDPFRGPLFKEAVEAAAASGDKEASDLLNVINGLMAGDDVKGGIGGPVKRLLEEVADFEKLGEEAVGASLRVKLVAAMYNLASNSQKVLMDSKRAADAAGTLFDPEADVIFKATLKYSQAAKENKPLMHAVADFVQDIAGGDTVHWQSLNVDTLERVLTGSGIDSDMFVTIVQLFKHNPELIKGGFKAMRSNAGKDLGGEGAAAIRAGQRAKTFTLAPDKESKDFILTPDELSKALGVHLEKYEPTAKVAGGLGNFIRRLDKSRVALLTTGFATTVVNVLGSAGSLAFGTAAAAIENAWVYGGKALTRDAGQRNKAMGDWARDTFAVSRALFNDTRTRDMFDELLKGNPTIKNAVVRQMQEVGAEDVSKLVRAASHLNIITDGFYRRARFMAEVDRALMRSTSDAGLPAISLEKFIVSGHTMDSKILRHAANESLKDTFAYSPNKELNGIPKKLIDTVTALGPITSIATPFPRFMYNAMAWQLKYSAVNPVVKLIQMAQYNAMKRGAKALKEGGEAGLKAAKKEAGISPEQLVKASSEGIVGTIVLVAAMSYRANHQDTEWSDVGGFDAQNLFPFAPFLAFSDFLIKWSNMDSETGKGVATLDFTKTIKTLVGLNSRSGTPAVLIDEFVSYFDSDLKEVTGATIGKVLGEYLGGIFAIPRTIKDIITIGDEEWAYARDNKILESQGGYGKFAEATWNGIKKNFPLGDLNEDIAHDGLTSGPTVKAGLIKQLIGVAPTKPNSEVAKELLRLGMPEFKVIPASGEPMVDDYVNQALAPMIESSVTSVLSDSSYVRYTDVEKRNRLLQIITTTKEIAKSYARTHAAGEAAARTDKLQIEYDNYKANSNGTDRDKKNLITKEVELIRSKYDALTGPFARALWLGSPKDWRAEADLYMRASKTKLLRDIANGYKPSELEKLKLYGEGYSVESLGLYGLGAILAKEFHKGATPSKRISLE